VFRRCDGEGEALETEIGLVPAEGEIKTEGTSVTAEDMKLLLDVDREAVRSQLPQLEEHLARFGDRLPEPLQAQLAALKQRLAD
jgi:phosphoenolpyruvate carboxykinase (GTP)